MSWRDFYASKVEARVGCGHCGAQRGERCRNYYGERVYRPHQARWEALQILHRAEAIWEAS